MKRNRDRSAVELADVRPGQTRFISRSRALQHCSSGLAYFLNDGRLRFRTFNPRQGSDVYIKGNYSIRIDKSNHFSRLKHGPQFPHLVFEHGANS